MMERKETNDTKMRKILKKIGHKLNVIFFFWARAETMPKARLVEKLWQPLNFAHANTGTGLHF